MNRLNLNPGFKAKLVQLSIDETMFRYYLDIKEDFLFVQAIVPSDPLAFSIIKVDNDEEPFNYTGLKANALEMLLSYPYMPFDIATEDLLHKPGKYYFPSLPAIATNEPFAYTLPYPIYTEPYIEGGKRKFSWYMDDTVLKMRAQFAYQGHISIDGLGEVEWNADGFNSAHEHLKEWGNFIRQQMDLSGLFPDGAPVYTLEGNRLSFEYDAALPLTTYNYYPFTFDPIFVPGYKPAYALILVKS